MVFMINEYKFPNLSCVNCFYGLFGMREFEKRELEKRELEEK
jgi:hypothetical protein